MEKFNHIDPEIEKREQEKILKKVDPRIAEILRKHLPEHPLAIESKDERPTPPPLFEGETVTKKKAGSFIENSLPESDR